MLFDAPRFPGNIPPDPFLFRRVFESLPGLYLLLSPELVILTASESYLREFLLEREAIVEKPLFEVFADRGGPSEVNAAALLQASLRQVLATEQPHRVDIGRYPLPAGGRAGVHPERHWLPNNTPVLDENGNVACIIHHLEEVDGKAKVQQEPPESDQQLRTPLTGRTGELPAASGWAEPQHDLLHNLFMQAPAMIAMVRGPELVYELVNSLYQQQLFPGRTLLGKPLLEAVPEIKGQPIMDILYGVYRTGMPYTGTEMPILLDRAGNGQPETVYFDFIYQPLRNAEGEVNGIVSFAYDVTGQVEMRRQVEKNENRFRTLLESIPQMAWTATAEGELDYFNANWYAYTGQTQAEALGNGWTRATHPDDVAPVLPKWQHARQTGTPYQVECRYQRIDGSWRWHLTRAVPLRSETGDVFKWVGTCTDIHEQKLYTQQLLEREMYFRYMADNVPVIIWVTRPDGYCTYLNKQWYDYTGQTPEEAMGLGWLLATHPQDAGRSQEAFLAANNGQTPFVQLYRLRGRDGSYRWYLDKGDPKFDRVGNFEGFVGVVIDVHEQHLAEERLQLSVKAGRVGIWEWDVVNNRATYSDLLREMFGMEPGTFEGEFEGAYEVYQRIIHPEDRQFVNEQVNKAFRNREKEFYIEFRVARTSGEITWIAERGEVVFEGQQPMRMNGTCIDITHRKRAEQEAQRMSEDLAALNQELAASNEELRAANEEIQAANEELGQTNRQLASINADLDNFVYTASHDLKAPILNIEGLIKALERQLSSETRQAKTVSQIYELLYASVDRFKTTIRDLTEVARIGKESQEDVASIDLADVFEEVQQDLEPQIAEAGAQIETRLDCPQVYFSRKNLKSVLYNLLSNAVKYRSPDRKLQVRLTCYTLETHHVLTIEDNGLGIDMRQEDKIFALFRRLHSHVEGTGIGLYIVKKMLENAGGAIEVSSQVGVGSTFRVYFKR